MKNLQVHSVPRPNNARQRFLYHDEADRLLEALGKKSGQIARIAKMSLYSGMRLSEIFALRWSDVDLRNNIITVLDAKKKSANRGRSLSTVR